MPGTGLTATYTERIGAGGTATVRISPNTKQRTWIVTQVSVELASAPLGATCELRRNGFLVAPLIATGDVAAGEPPVRVTGSDVLTVTWAGCTAGTTAAVLIIYDEVT